MASNNFVFIPAPRGIACLISGSAYNSTISSTYLNYLNGYIDKLDFRDTYLIFNADQYNTLLVYGKDVNVSGSSFTSSDVNYVRINHQAYSDYAVYTGSDSLNVDVGNCMVYSNADGYPRSLQGGTYAGQITICLLLVLSLVLGIVNNIFKWH